MTGREYAILAAIAVAVAIHYLWQWRECRKIENPSPPPPGEGPSNANDQPERVQRTVRPRGDVDHGPANCPDSGCPRCRHLPPAWQPADPVDEDPEDDEPPLPRWRAWLGI